MKPRKAAVLSEVNTEMIAARRKIRNEFMMELCKRALDGKGIPDE